MWLKDTLDFYPTPDEVTAQMIEGVNIAGLTILEPSAGSGNIVRFLKKNGAKEVIACEIDPRLKKILQQECRIIKDDFLSLTKEDISHVDMIVMNPPFSAQEKHLLHAWEIAPSGCHIIAITNSSMLTNRYSENRQIIRDLIQFNGSSERLGNVFKESERTTNVDISLINLYVPISEEDDFSEYFDLSEEYERNDQEGVIQYDFLRDIVNRYVGALKLFDDVLHNAVAMNSLIGEYSAGNLTFTCNIKDTPTERNTFKKELQKKMWHHIFSKMNMQKYVTLQVRADINKFIEQQTHVPFTMKNIYKMIEMIVGTQASRMDRTLVEAFEHICSFSYKNSTAGEKWKTNSDYMINRKFIIPYMTESDFYGVKYEYVRAYHRRSETMTDIVKALCYLTGISYNDFVRKHSPEGREYEATIYNYYIENKIEWGQWTEWAFFRMKGYKKGTLHVEFLDEEVWINFNKRVAEIKGWRLPTAGKEKEKSKSTNKTKEVTLF